MKKLFLFVLSGFLLFKPLCVMGEGLTMPGLSGDSAARGDMILASTEGADAVYYNPAALADLKGSNFLVDVKNLWAFGGVKLKGTNKEVRNSANYNIIPSLYYTNNFGLENITFGFGVNSPFGLGVTYAKDSTFQYITQKGDIRVMQIILPSIGYKVNDKLFLGANIKYYQSTLKIQTQYPWAAIGFSNGFAATDGEVKIDGSGGNFGGDIAALYKISEQHSLAFVYRSQVVVKYDGEAKITNNPAALGLPAEYTTDVETSIKWPDYIGLGYAFKPNDKLTVETDIHWRNWDDFEKLEVDVDKPLSVFLVDNTSRFDWKNAFTIGTSVKYGINDALTAKGAYYYSKSPTRASTYDPLIPDLDFHAITLGAAYKIGDLTIDPSFLLAIAPKKDINSDRADLFGLGQNVDGEYDLTVVSFGVGVSYKF